MDRKVIYGVAEDQEDLVAIRNLQGINLPQSITSDELRQEGFVTVQHDLGLLKEMNQPYPHIVARHHEEIIGYTLVMLRAFSQRIPILIPMFEEIDRTVYRDKLLGDSDYLVMGQVCIAKGYRGKGVFAGLYAEMKRRLSADFDYLITEVSERNPRSIRAHQKIGFVDIKRYHAAGEDWIILLWELR